MAITKEDVTRVASLSKLAINESELEQYTGQLGKILELVEQLEQVDTTGVPFTSNVTEERNVMRADKAEKGTDRDLLMQNVPQSKDGFIQVPAIMDNGEAGA